MDKSTLSNIAEKLGMDLSKYLGNDIHSISRSPAAPWPACVLIRLRK
jgi:hypothetical protein